MTKMWVDKKARVIHHFLTARCYLGRTASRGSELTQLLPIEASFYFRPQQLIHHTENRGKLD